MKKKILGAVVVVAIAVGAMINVNLNKVSNKGDLALANVEALAQGEDYGITCNQFCSGNSQCWQFKWGYNNLSYTCYFSGYQYNHCFC